VLCANCNWRKERGRRTNKSATQRRYYAKLKTQVLDRYGRACVCCGVADSIVLTLDHTRDDGAQHRKELSPKHPRAGGVAFYGKLRRLGFPDGLQTLCWNCNTAKARFGTCPHTYRSNAATT
jgi:5-methylcytosine-specific restriction endonuclease McrA